MQFCIMRSLGDPFRVHPGTLVFEVQRLIRKV